MAYQGYHQKQKKLNAIQSQQTDSESQQSDFIPTVTVTHRKKERARDDDPKKYFEFEWVTALTLNQRFTDFTSARFNVVDYSFNDATLGEIRHLTRERMKPFYKPALVRNTVSSITPDEIFSALLESLDMYKEPAIMAYHPHMSHSLPAAQLLQCLQKLVKSRAPISLNWTKQQKEKEKEKEKQEKEKQKEKEKKEIVQEPQEQS